MVAIAFRETLNKLSILERSLYEDQCVNKNRSFNLGVIAALFRARFKEGPEDVASRLKGKGYITAVPKRAIKCYISDIRRAVYSINSRGGNATKGRILPHKQTMDKGDIHQCMNHFPGCLETVTS